MLKQTREQTESELNKMKEMQYELDRVCYHHCDDSLRYSYVI